MENRLHDIATVLGVADNRGDALGRLPGLKLEAGFKAQPPRLHRLGQHRAFAFKPGLHGHARFADLRLHHFPVPGNLRKQSEGQREAEIGEGRRGAIVPAGALRLVTVDRKTPGAALLAHPFQGLSVRLQDDFSFYLKIVGHDGSSNSLRKLETDAK